VSSCQRTRDGNSGAEILNRTIDIAWFRTRLRVGVDEPKDLEPEIEVKRWLELRGVIDAPIRRTSDIVLRMCLDARTKVGTARPEAVGSIIGVRSAVEAVVSIPHAEFDRLWSFAPEGSKPFSAVQRRRRQASGSPMKFVVEVIEP